MQTITSACVNGLTGLFFATLPSSLGTEMYHSTIPLNKKAAVFYIREDNNEPSKVVNIFDNSGNKVYTLVHFSKHSAYWHVFSEPTHTPEAIVQISVLRRGVHASSTTKLTPNPGLFGKLHRHFYDDRDGMLCWNRRSQYLERITNPRAGHGEHRIVVSEAKQMRRKGLDWEVKVDTESVETLLALASAFITIKTQWIIPKRALVPGVRDSARPSISKEPVAAPRREPSGERLDGFLYDDVQKLLVFKPPPVSTKPREFFNPPEFMKNLH